MVKGISKQGLPGLRGSLDPAREGREGLQTLPRTHTREKRENDGTDALLGLEKPRSPLP